MPVTSVAIQESKWSYGRQDRVDNTDWTGQQGHVQRDPLDAESLASAQNCSLS